MVIGLRKSPGTGIPRTPEERVAAHYGIDIIEARRWLTIHPESMLVPARGTGFTRGTAAGISMGISIGVSPGQKLTAWQGDTVRMHVGFDYKGPAITGLTLRCSIGQRRTIWPYDFDEIAYGRATINVDQSFDFRSYTAFADIDTSPISPGSDYDIEAKIEEYMDETLVSIDNVIDILGVAEFQNFAITGYEKV